MKRVELNKKIEALEDAKEQLQEVIELIEDAVKGTTLASRAEAYIIPSLKMCLGQGHGYLGSQPCDIDEMIKDMDDEEVENE